MPSEEKIDDDMLNRFAGGFSQQQRSPPAAATA